MRSASREPSFAMHPLALLAAVLACGILLRHFASMPVTLLLSVGAGTLLVPLLLLNSRNKIWPTLAVILATFLAGANLESVAQRAAPANQIRTLLQSGVIKGNDPVELTGVLSGPPQYTPDGFYLTLQVERLRLDGLERSVTGVVQLWMLIPDDSVRAECDALDLNFGTRVRVVTILERPDNYRNPGVSSFTEFLERQGQDATGKLKSPRLLERLDDRPGFPPLRWLYQWRATLERETLKHFSAETAGVLAASLLGNRYYLSHQTAERFREGGTFHVLVISGLHITFIGGIVILLARRLTKRKWLQFVSSLAVLWSYTLAVGADSSVVRSALMFSLVGLGPLVARRAGSLNALGGAGLMLLVWHPRTLFDPSFQLTFLSVLAIVVLAAPLMHRLSQIGIWRPALQTPYPPAVPRWLRAACETIYWSEVRWRGELADANYSYQLFKSPLAARLEQYHLQSLIRYAFGALVVSLSVQVMLLPLLILYFHRLSLSSLILNIFVSVLMALLGVTALVALVVVQVSTVLATPLITLANATSWLMVHSVDLFSSLGIESMRLPEYNGWAAMLYAVYYLPLTILLYRLSTWNLLRMPIGEAERRGALGFRLSLLFQLALLLVLLIHPLSAGRPDGKLRIDFLDVGQGDAALVTMPDGRTLLIDGGGRPSFSGPGRGDSNDSSGTFARDSRSIGEAVVSEYLWWRGLGTIDFIIPTHADADHIDGLNDVARNFKVGQALVGRTPALDPEYIKFRETLRRRAIPQRVVSAGDVLSFGEVTLAVLWPPAAPNEAPSRNNDSIVLLLRYGRRTILMTGDVEKEGEAAILRGGSDIHCDVMKVPHHGSRTSSTAGFVDATQPQLAIISVGNSSMFGHPTRDVVERWRASGAEVMTTGRRGTITVSTDGVDLRVETFIQ